MTMAIQRRSADDAAVHVLETLAERHQILPLSRFTRPHTDAVTQLMNCLGQGPRSNHPWLPLGTLGPLLIMGHYNPASFDFMGVPKPFRVEVIITTRMYDERFLEFFMNWSRKSGLAMNAGRPPVGIDTPREASITQTLEWFIKHYPFKASERDALVQKLKSLVRHTPIGPQEIDDLIPQLGVALETIRTGCLAFNPAYAPPLGEASEMALSILEDHNVYPLLESARTRYWLCTEGVNLRALESDWSRLHGIAPKVITVLAARQAIRRKIQHERSRRSRTDS